MKVYFLRPNFRASSFWWKLLSATLNRWNKFLDFTNAYDMPKDSSLLIKTPGLFFPVRRVWNRLMDMTNEWSLCCHVIQLVHHRLFVHLFKWHLSQYPCLAILRIKHTLNTNAWGGFIFIQGQRKWYLMCSSCQSLHCYSVLNAFES